MQWRSALATRKQKDAALLARQRKAQEAQAARSASGKAQKPPKAILDIDSIGERLKVLMMASGMSARELSQRLDVTPQAISQWLSGQTTPSARRLLEIAAIFQITLMTSLDNAGADVISPRELAAGLLSEAAAPGRSALDGASAKTGRWRVPRDAIFDAVRGGSDIAVIRIADDALDPDLRVSDCVFADLACHAVVAPGIYLVVIAGRPAWRRCQPLINGRVRVADRSVQEEADASELRVLARAMHVFKRL